MPRACKVNLEENINKTVHIFATFVLLLMAVASWILTSTGFWSHIHNSFMQILIFPKHLFMCFPQGQLCNALDKAFGVYLVLSTFSYQFLQFPITFEPSKNLKSYISSHFWFFLLTDKSYRPLQLKANCMSGLKKNFYQI